MRNFALIASALLLAGCAGKTNSDKSQDNASAEVVADTEDRACVCTADDGSVCYWVKDNSGDKLMARSLFPDATDELMSSMGFNEGVPSSISVFYFQTSDGWILFDAGLGSAMGGKATDTSVANVSRDSIKTVYLTHFHGDHIGGMLDNGAKAFSNAKVYVNQTEYDSWITNAPEGENELQRNVMNAYKDDLVFFSYGDTLPNSVVAIEAPGHTPGHTVFQKSNVLVIGDLMHGYDLQSVHPEISCQYDDDSALAAESRVKVLGYAKGNNLVMVGMHQPAIKK